MTNNAAGPAAFPVGAAAVKEIFGPDGKITEIAVSVKTAATGAGQAWYWYEAAGQRVIADGNGIRGCIGCHGTAGSDNAHTGKDYVFTAVAAKP